MFIVRIGNDRLIETQRTGVLMDRMNNTNRIQKKNNGSTMVEMVVTFALLSIFMVSAAVIIGTVTNLFYRIKAETYAKQVSDIVLEKVTSEIEGAKYNSKTESLNPKILNEADVESDYGVAIELSDKTDTRIRISADVKTDSNPESDGLIIHYFAIERVKDSESFESVDWKFNSSVYNGFSISELTFVRGDKLKDYSGKTAYGLTSNGDYGKNVIVVLLHLNSDRYGDYYTYRFVKMYNVPEA